MLRDKMKAALLVALQSEEVYLRGFTLTFRVISFKEYPHIDWPHSFWVTVEDSEALGSMNLTLRSFCQDVSRMEE